MICGCRSARHVVACSALALLGCVASFDSGRAQGLRHDEIGPRAWPPPVVRKAERRITPPVEEEEPAPVREERRADDAATDDDESTDPAGTGSPRRSSGRPQIRDGDLSWPAEPVASRDGVIESAEPDSLKDGPESIGADVRSAADVAAFERPPAGFDPDSFALEVVPILDRRPEYLYRFEPFEAVGIRVGSFLLLPEAEIAGASSSNLFRSSSHPRSDVALELRPNVRMVSNWRTHALELRATGNASFHNRYASEDDRAAAVEARGRLDITRRTNVEALASYDLAQEARGSINAPSAAGDRGDVETRRLAVAFNHRINRLQLQLRGSIIDYDYSPVRTETGAIATNDDRDSVQKASAFRAAWNFKPELAVFAETAVNARTYRAAPGDGILRDSIGDRYRAGVSFGNTSRILRGEISIGYGRQVFDDPRLTNIDGVIVDANLAWRISPLTALLVTAQTDVSESTVAGSGGAFSQSAGIEVRHAFQHRLIGTAGVRVAQQDYAGVVLSEHDVTSHAGLEYHLSRELALFGRYQHVAFTSTDPARNYNVDEARIGMRVRR